MRLIFWYSAAFIAYVYVGYLLLLTVWARWIPGPRLRVSARTIAPSLTIVIAARNEAARLPARIANLLALDYPADRRQIVVVSNGSTDDTPGALAPFMDHVELVTLASPDKAAALNAGVERATGEILLFADARQTFGTQAAAAITAPFADPAIGAVSGELVLGCEPGAGRRRDTERRCLIDAAPRADELRLSADRRRDQESTVGDSVRYYWGYEKQLRKLESTVGSMLGATGAIYAMRRVLWRPLPDGLILDDVLAPMRAVLSGARAVFEPRAQAFDQTALDARAERHRKVRTLAGNAQILWAEPRLLIPFVNPVWLQYVSHKVGRMLVPYALLGLFGSSIVLAPHSLFYAVALAGQCAFYLQSAYGWWLERRHRYAPRSSYSVVQRAGRVAFTFVMLNASAVAGLCAALAGKKVWR